MKKIYLFLLAIFAFAGIFKSQSLSLTVSPVMGCSPLPVTINYSEAGAVSYDIKISNNAGYSQLYSAVTLTTLNGTIPYGGYFNIEVWAFDGIGSNIGYSWQYVQVSGPAGPTIQNSAQNNSCPGDDVYFQAQGYDFSGNGFTMDWNMGNGTVYTAIPYNSVQTNYPNPGTYTITATANFASCGVYTSSDTLVVSNSAGTIPTFTNWIYPNDSVCPGDAIHLDGPNMYQLYVDYGDGNYENNLNGHYITDHTYPNSGTYYASVTAKNGCGNFYTVYDTIHVVGGLPYQGWAPVVNFNDSIICPNSEVYFYPGFFGGSHVKWDFGNNDTTSISNPSRTFTSLGTKLITLTAYNGCGSSKSSSRNLYVVDTIQAGTINLSMTDSICPGSPFMVGVGIGNQGGGDPSKGPAITYNFGDTTLVGHGALGHAYSGPGTYTVTVSSLNGCGFASSASQQIYVGANAGTQPTVMFMAVEGGGGGGSNSSSSYCPGDSAIFILFPSGGNNTYQIDFGDGSPLAGAPSLLHGPGGLYYDVYKHVYSTAGTYSATCNYSSPCGGVVKDTVPVNITGSAPIKDAGFFYDDQKYYCLGDPITFYSYGGNSFEWDFGDGSGKLLTTGILRPVTHIYQTPGFYTITLVVTNGCGLKDTSTSAINMPDTRINIITNQVKSSCNNDNGKAIAIASGGTQPYTYDWTNGDHNFIADSIPAGIYVVTIHDKNGCSNYGIATVSDVQAATILANNIIDASCFGGNDGVIDINVIGSSAPYTYQWSNGSTNQDISNLVSGPYEVVVTDANGCHSTKSIFVNQPDDFIVSFTNTSPACGTSLGAITANVLGNSGPYYYVWSNGINNAVNAGITAGIYNLVVVDSKGCLKQETATLNNQGGPIVGIDSVTALNCGSGGSGIYITASSAATPLTYGWTNGASNFSTADISSLAAGSYSLTVTDANGCVSTRVVDLTDSKPITDNVCLVTVDTTTYTNKVIWESVVDPNIASYNIYRESSQAGLYYLVGNVNKDSLHQFIDPVADPSIRPWRYKLSTVSSCGTESDISDFHKTIHLTVNKGLTDSTYNLIWDDYEGQTTYTTFYIWIYKNTTGWVKIDSIAKTDHSYTSFVNGFSSLTSLYYFVEAGPLNGCDPTRAIVNTSRSNIKQIVFTPPPPDTTSIGIAKHDLDAEDFLIYPNPSKGQITIKSGRDWGKTRIEIIDVLGQVIYREDAAITSKIVDLSNFANGIYFVRVYKGDKAMSKKILLNR